MTTFIARTRYFRHASGTFFGPIIRVLPRDLQLPVRVIYVCRVLTDGQWEKGGLEYARLEANYVRESQRRSRCPYIRLPFRRLPYTCADRLQPSSSSSRFPVICSSLFRARLRVIDPTPLYTNFDFVPVHTRFECFFTDRRR